MKRHLIAFALVIVACLGGYAARGSVTHSETGSAGPPEQITIGKMPIEAHALLYIAEDRGFFAGNGVTVAIRDYATGPEAMDALANGEVGIAASGEYVAVDHAFREDPISIIAAIDRYQFFSLAARRDRGIANVSDLAGRTIGVGRRSTAEFFLGRFLNLNGIGIGEVTLRDVPSSQWTDAIANGSVDAVVYNRGYDDAIRSRLGADGIVWPVQSDQPLYSVLVCRNDWAANHSAAMTRFLAALDQAEHYARENPADAQAIVKKELNMTAAETAMVWQQNQFALSLDESLVVAMQDEARWMIANNLTNATVVPDLRSPIDTTALATIRPGAVTIL